MITMGYPGGTEFFNNLFKFFALGLNWYYSGKTEPRREVSLSGITRKASSITSITSSGTLKFKELGRRRDTDPIDTGVHADYVTTSSPSCLNSFYPLSRICLSFFTPRSIPGVRSSKLVTFLAPGLYVPQKSPCWRSTRRYWEPEKQRRQGH